MTLNVNVITFIPLVYINIRTTFKKIVPKIHTIFVTHFTEHFAEHILQNTLCRTLCGTHFVEHI